MNKMRKFPALAFAFTLIAVMFPFAVQAQSLDAPNEESLHKLLTMNEAMYSCATLGLVAIGVAQQVKSLNIEKATRKASNTLRIQLLSSLGNKPLPMETLADAAALSAARYLLNDEELVFSVVEAAAGTSTRYEARLKAYEVTAARCAAGHKDLDMAVVRDNIMAQFRQHTADQ